jgi:zinc protease
MPASADRAPEGRHRGAGAGGRGQVLRRRPAHRRHPAAAAARPQRTSPHAARRPAPLSCPMIHSFRFCGRARAAVLLLAARRLRRAADPALAAAQRRRRVPRREPLASRWSTCRSTSTAAAGATPPRRPAWPASRPPSAGKGVLAAGNEPALDENQLGEAWADLGAGFGGDAGSDRMSYSLRSLTDPALLAAPCTWPRARSASRRSRPRLAARAPAHRRRHPRVEHAPGTVAGRTYRQAVYGGHPYGYETTEATLAPSRSTTCGASIAATCCRAAPRSAWSATSPAAQADADGRAAAVAAAAGRGRCPALPPVPDRRPGGTGFGLIPFKSAQAHVLIGQPGFRRSDPDFFALLVGNYILGGSGLVSRLSDEVREKRGLSYGASSSFSPGLHAGAFTVGLQTRPDQARSHPGRAGDAGRFVAEGPTDRAQGRQGQPHRRLRAAHRQQPQAARQRVQRSPGTTCRSTTWTPGRPRWTGDGRRRAAAMARKLQPERMVTVTVGPPRPGPR